jgi:hypothetical protein
LTGFSFQIFFVILASPKLLCIGSLLDILQQPSYVVKEAALEEEKRGEVYKINATRIVNKILDSTNSRIGVLSLFGEKSRKTLCV